MNELTMTTEENVGIFIEAWKVMVGRLPDAQILQEGGVATTFAHVPLPFLNISTVDRPAATTEEFAALLALTAERARGCPHPSLVALSDAWAPADWESVAHAAGLELALNMTGMVAEELLPPRRPAPELEIRRVSDERTARDLAMLNAHAYGMPTELFECICNLHLWQPDTFGYVGYADGRAVSTASTFPAGGTVYVALVATMPDAQGRGYAEAVMRHAVTEGQRGMGVKRTTLHATDMGRPVYQAMGFVPGTSIKALAPAGH